MIDDINRNIIDRIVVERSKQLDSAIFGEIQQIAIENGIETRITMNEKAIADARKKQIPKKIEIWNGQCACPNCEKLYGNYSTFKKLTTWEMPFCKYCGQALDWSE